MESSQFTWVPAYEAIANAIYEMRETPERLTDALASIFDGSHGVSFPTNAGEPFESSGVDPFTFFASFNRQLTWQNRAHVVELALDCFGIKGLETPQDFDGIPVANNLHSWFFGANNDRKNGDVQGLWEAFCRAIEYADNPSEATASQFARAYDAAQTQFLVSWNLTMGLFWIRPNAFLNLDSRNRQYLKGTFDLNIKHVPTGEQYLALLEQIKHIQSKPFYELSLEAWSWTEEHKQKPAEHVSPTDNDDGWYPTLDEYDPGITENVWTSLLADSVIFDDQSYALVKRLADAGGAATCSQLSQTYGESMNYYLGAGTGLAQRVAQKTKCPLWAPDSKSRYWPVAFLGTDAATDEPGTFKWKLRPELAAALEHVDLSSIPLYATNNSPTTEGHHYWWLTANSKIWSFSQISIGEEQHYTMRNERGNPRRIYSNFLAAQKGDIIVGYQSTPSKQIVALCQVSKDNDGENLYFTKMRDLETPVPLAVIKADPVLSSCEFCKNPNGSFFKLTEEEFSQIESYFEDDSPTATSTKHIPYSDEQFLNSVYVNENDLTTMKALLNRKKNLILQGAPGTGKTFAAKRLAYALMGEQDDSRIELVQFHQSTTYEDFVIGYRPNGDGGFDIQPGVFTRFCRRAAADQEHRPYIFIIDEINRANISKVFGELLMLIEADHRNDSVLLPVDGSRLSVPDNLYLIGMMNTADRGLALIDYALRRRFAFFEMKPALDHPKFRAMLKNAHNEKLTALVDKVILINRQIADDPALGPGFCIGHSYFCTANTLSDEEVAAIARYEIEPLIAEYWFDDCERVRTCRDQLESVL